MRASDAQEHLTTAATMFREMSAPPRRRRNRQNELKHPAALAV
jgi:hypothetical protein